MAASLLWMAAAGCVPNVTVINCNGPGCDGGGASGGSTGGSGGTGNSGGNADGAAGAGGTGGQAGADAANDVAGADSGGSGGGACPGLIFQDDFSDPITLESYELPFGVDQQIIDGVLRQTSHPGATVANGGTADVLALAQPSLLAGATDYVVEIDARIAARTGNYGLFGLVFRADSSGRHYGFTWNGNIENSVPHWQVEKVVTPSSYSYLGGSFGGGATTPAYVPGNWVHLRAEVTAARIRGLVDLHDGKGLQLVYDVTDTSAPFTTGTVGVRSGWLVDPNLIEFDNLRISCSGPLQISPTTVTLPAGAPGPNGQHQSFSVTGGSPPYTFAAAIGSVDATTGAYTPPSGSAVDTVTVTDAATRSSSATVVVVSQVSHVAGMLDNRLTAASATNLPADGPLGTNTLTWTAYGLATDGKIIWIMDSVVLRALDVASGVLTTKVGPAALGNCGGDTLAYDGHDLFVLQGYPSTCNFIKKVSLSDYSVTSLAGTGTAGATDGPGAIAQFNRVTASGIATDGTYLYVADSGNNRIRRVDKTTGFTTTLAFTAAQPMSVAVSPRKDFLYVACYSAQVIQQVDLATGAVTTIAGAAGTSGAADNVGLSATFHGPDGIATDGAYLYISDDANSLIRQMSLATGQVSTLAGTAGYVGPSADGSLASAKFQHPAMQLLPTASGVYFLDYYALRLIR